MSIETNKAAWNRLLNKIRHLWTPSAPAAADAAAKPVKRGPIGTPRSLSE